MPLKKIAKIRRTRHYIALVHSSLAPSPASLYGTKEIGTKIILHQPPPSTIHFAIGTKYVYVDQVYVKSRTKSEQQYVKNDIHKDSIKQIHYDRPQETLYIIWKQKHKPEYET